MNINLELYRVFSVVANCGNITKASKELLISQPAISKSIKQLEEQLGGTLFIRTKRGVVLTEEGKEFYHYIKHAMEHITNAENKFTNLINLETGCIKIGISQTLTKQFLLPFLKQFHEKYPKIDIQIDTSMADDLVLKLRSGLVDMIVLNLPTFNHNDTIIYPCKEIQDCFIANKNYFDFEKTPLPISEITKYPLLLQPKNNNTRRFIDNFCEKQKLNLQPIMTLGSYQLIIEFTKNGFGIGYTTKDFIQKEIEEGSLYEIKTIPEIPKRQIGLMISKNSIPSFSTQKLIEIILKK